MIIAGIPKAFCLTNCLSPLRKRQNQRQLMSCLFGTLNGISHVKMCFTQLDLAVGDTKHFGKFILHPSQTRCCGVWGLRTNQHGALLPRGGAPCLRRKGVGRSSCQSAAVGRETWGHLCSSLYFGGCFECVYIQRKCCFHGLNPAQGFEYPTST